MLSAAGRLDSLQHTARLPGPVIDAWGAEESRLLFSPEKRSVLARQVGTAAMARLEAWKLLGPASIVTLFNVLADRAKPVPRRPARLESLASIFWAYARQHLPAEWAWKDWWRNAAYHSGCQGAVVWGGQRTPFLHVIAPLAAPRKTGNLSWIARRSSMRNGRRWLTG